MPSCRVRPYTPADRAAVRRICADTGCMGNPIDPIFCDRDVFTDYLTRYYTDWEYDLSLVAEDEETGEVVGYLLGCRRYRYNAVVSALLLACVIVPKGLWRIATFRYNRASLQFLWWIFTRAGKETPAAPKHMAHFHINLLPPYRNGQATRILIFPYVKALAARGDVRGVFGQMQVRDDTRTARMFERYGFQILERRRISKWDHLTTEPVYLATACMDFSKTDPTHGRV